MEKNNRVVQLDYIKAVSIMMIVVTHCAFTAADRKRPVFILLINMAMPLFMLVYGYVRNMSHSSKEYGRKEKMASWLKNVYSILIPGLIAYAAEFLLLYIFDGLPANLLQIIWEDGGIGPGSYYIPVLLQLVILYPIVEYFFKKNPAATTAFLICFEIAFELFANQFIGDKAYRLLCFRYLIFIVAGMNMFQYRDRIIKRKNIIFALSSISLIWLYFIVYREYHPHIFTRWTTTAFPVVFLAMVLMILALVYVKPINGIAGRLLSEIGQASYYIFLVQMAWFGVPLCPADLPKIPTVAVSLIFTVYFGILFKNIERGIYRKIFRTTH